MKNSNVKELTKISTLITYTYLNVKLIEVVDRRKLYTKHLNMT